MTLRARLFDGPVGEPVQAHGRACPGAKAAVLGEADAGCTVLHVDMDAFYAAVEIRRRPELAGRPVVVGGTGNRGVVCSASYEARAFGVRSAMPVVRARALCPQAVFLPLDGAAYREASVAVMAIFNEFTPLVEPLSLDEAFLDVAGALRRLGSPKVIGQQIRDRITEQQRLTCSVGVARNKFVAKLASQHAKPDGLLVIPAERTLDFLRPLPVGSLWGVGRQTGAALERLGIRTVADLASYPKPGLRHAVGDKVADGLHELAHGRDSRKVQPDRPDKSIGAEHTFAEDLTTPHDMQRELLRLAETVARRLRVAGYRARTIGLKLRFADFATINRTRTLPHATDSTQHIYRIATELLAGLALDKPRVRLLGIRTENVTAADSGLQLELTERVHGWRDADVATDAVAHKFGDAAIGRLTGLNP